MNKKALPCLVLAIANLITASIALGRSITFFGWLGVGIIFLILSIYYASKSDEEEEKDAYDNNTYGKNR